jgi:hypothetical protein
VGRSKWGRCCLCRPVNGTATIFQVSRRGEGGVPHKWFQEWPLIYMPYLCPRTMPMCMPLPVVPGSVQSHAASILLFFLWCKPPVNPSCT